MKTQDNDTVGTQPASRQPGVRAGGKGWLAGLGAVVVVALSGSCQVTVNAANGNEIYIVTSAGSGQTSDVLKHSTDGGQTWETIQPVLHSPGGNSTMPWYVQQLRLARNRLFALQWTLLDNRLSSLIKSYRSVFGKVSQSRAGQVLSILKLSPDSQREGEG